MQIKLNVHKHCDLEGVGFTAAILNTIATISWFPVDFFTNKKIKESVTTKSNYDLKRNKHDFIRLTLGFIPWLGANGTNTLGAFIYTNETFNHNWLQSR